MPDSMDGHTQSVVSMVQLPTLGSSGIHPDVKSLSSVGKHLFRNLLFI